jgi:hypothetical protein
MKSRTFRKASENPDVFIPLPKKKGEELPRSLD